MATLLPLPSDDPFDQQGTNSRLIGIYAPNHIESWGFWSAKDTSLIFIVADSDGTAVINATFDRGASSPDKPTILIISNIRKNFYKCLVINSPINLSINIPVSEGFNEIGIYSVNKPSITISGDSRIMLGQIARLKLISQNVKKKHINLLSLQYISLGDIIQSTLSGKRLFSYQVAIMEDILFDAIRNKDAIEYLRTNQQFWKMTLEHKKYFDSIKGKADKMSYFNNQIALLEDIGYEYQISLIEGLRTAVWQDYIWAEVIGGEIATLIFYAKINFYSNYAIRAYQEILDDPSKTREVSARLLYFLYLM